MQRPITSASRSPRRAQMPTMAPRSASASANPAPMPDDAPVTSVRHPFRSNAIFHPAFAPRARSPYAAEGIDVHVIARKSDPNGQSGGVDES